MKFRKRILVIGDVHGRDDWREIANEALLNFQHIIFEGDYVDSFNISPAIIKQNLLDIIEFKKKHMEEVTLLLGNHDWAYIYDRNGISGFKWHMWQEYKKIFKDNLDLFDLAWGYMNTKTKKYTLATHAGLTYTYWNNYVLTRLKNPEDKLYQLTEGNFDGYFIHEILNFMKGEDIIWKVGEMRGGHGTPGPIWADYLELLEDPYPEINQIVGHTASGTVSVDQFGDHFIAKVDGFYNKKLAHLQLNI